MATYFTSDLHFNHKNILLYCNRPFNSVNHMNQMLIANWNTIVTPEDTTYLLGDFSMGSKVDMPQFRPQLNGKIILIKGNHDEHKMLDKLGMDEIHDNLIIEIEGFKVMLRHKPSSNPAKYGVDYFLHGHVHSSYKNVGSSINVGVDVQDYKPRIFKELIAGIPPRDFRDMTSYVEEVEEKRHNNA